MGDPTSSYATVSIALRVSEALKPHHHDKVETTSVGRPTIQHSKVIDTDRAVKQKIKNTSNFKAKDVARTIAYLKGCST
jgi:hypothetical protein